MRMTMNKTQLRRAPLRFLIGFALAGMAAAALWGDSVQARADDSDDKGWTSFFNGKDLEGWQTKGKWEAAAEVSLDPANESAFKIEAGEGVLVNGPEGRTENLFTEEEHGDIEAHIEFVVPKGSNSGIYFQGRYEIQILDSFGVKEPHYNDCGGIYQRWADDKGFDGHAPRENASLAPGEWQSFDVVFRAPRFDKKGKKTAPARFVKVLHNGTLIHEDVDLSGPTRAAAYDDEQPKGPLMIQGDHGPVAFRNLRWRSLTEEARK